MVQAISSIVWLRVQWIDRAMTRPLIYIFNFGLVHTDIRVGTESWSPWIEMFPFRTRLLGDVPSVQFGAFRMVHSGRRERFLVCFFMLGLLEQLRH